MKSIKNKILAMILCAVIAAMPLSSCNNNGDNNSNNSTTTKANSGDSAETTTENIAEETVPTTTEVLPDLPEGINMQGKTFNILTSDWYSYHPFDFVDIAPEELNGEILNDAAVSRKSKIEDLYNIKIVEVASAMDGALSKLKKTVNSGDNAYDVAFIRGRNIQGLMGGDYLLDLEQLPYTDFNKPWWKKDAYDAFAVAGKHLGVSGAMSTNEIMTIWATFFNKSMIADYNLEKPYDLFKSGDWTWDKALEMGKVIASDINNDGKMTQDDNWGATYTYETVIGMFNAVGVKIAELDSEGTPKFIFNSENNLVKAQDVFDKLFDNTNVFGETLAHMSLWSSDADILNAGRALFSFSAFHVVDAMRASEVDFGIMPYPALTKNQENYFPYTMGINIPWIVVPKTNPDLDNTSIFMEAFAAEGYKTVVPAFYDNILKGKMTRDEESYNMIDYLYNNLKYDTGNLLNLFNEELFGLAQKYDRNLVSALEKNMGKVEKNIDKLVTGVKGE